MPCSLRQLFRRLADIEPGFCAQYAAVALLICLLSAFSACSSYSAPIQSAQVADVRVVLPATLYTTAESASATEALVASLIATERQAAIDGDLDLLAELWAPDARIVDGGGTDSPADDYVWQGRDAIMDRYALAVLPAPPPLLDPILLATLTLSGENEGNITAHLGVDRWKLTWQNARWWLVELRYN